jgi:DNA-directed RNA polymerase subunit RPC12/RpoP
MKSEYMRPEDLEWKCAKCNRELVLGTVTIEYLGNRFSTELAKCPHCGFVLVSEELALGKMAEVEQMLEDK